MGGEPPSDERLVVGGECGECCEGGRRGAEPAEGGGSP